MIGSDKFEVDAVRAINSKAPDFMMLLVKLFSMKVKDERDSPERNRTWLQLCVEPTWEVC
jgi:hypothetical protein